MSKPELYMIGGPTASGKTAAAVELAQKLGGVVINADAMQVYKGLPILTAQPSSEEKAIVPHKLFEVFCPSERSSVGKWLALAKTAIDEASAKGKIPILVGGTGLYFASLLGGLAHIPPVPDVVREEVIRLYNELGHDFFRVRLAEKDPQAASRIKPNDRQRLIRAYEVVIHTGQTLGQWHEQAMDESIGHSFTVHRRVMMPDREKLYARCDERFLRMIHDGAVDEVKELLMLGIDPELPAMKILGVPELSSYLQGRMTLSEAVTRGQQATRNYAKRQFTWFRNQWGVKGQS